ncbi:MAG: hypothetical protein J6Y61_02700 [Bacteroidales bacterium]|nr:hypothetical protein [Bacteroidales bacterium]
MKKQYYHISTKGLDNNLFKDEEDFRQIILILAIVFSQDEGTDIVIYSIMGNHIHIIVYGFLDVIEAQVNRMKKLYSMWYRNKYGMNKVLSRVPCKIRQCEDYEDVKTCIGYDYMNPVRAGLTNNAYYYPWSSISAHFRNEFHPFLDLPAEQPLKNKRKLYHTRLPIPENVRLLPNGQIDPASIITTEHVERIMKTSKSLNYFVGRARDSSGNAAETEFLSNDTTASAKAKAIARHVYGMDSPLEALPPEIKRSIADVLKYNYGTPSSVIDRVFALHRKTN